MSFTDEEIQAVWEKAEIVGQNEPNITRKDQCGAWIDRKEHGNRNSIRGWEIDHINPESKDGGPELSNLRPLQWENNLAKSDGRLSCVVIAVGAENIRIN